jgi:hypothetical protein
MEETIKDIKAEGFDLLWNIRQCEEKMKDIVRRLNEAGMRAAKEGE